MRPSLRTRSTRLLAAIGFVLVTVSPTQQFVRQPVPSEANGAAYPIEVNGDGLVDFVTLTPTAVRVRRNLGGSRFEFGAQTVPRRLLLPFPGLHAPAADFDGDGDQDLLVLAADSGIRAALLRNDGGTLVDAGTVTPPLAPTSQVSVAAFDADGDGDQDLLARTGVQLGLFLNDGTGTFVAAPAGTVPPVSSASWHGIGDLDGDGRADVAVVAASVLHLLMARQAVFVDESAARLPWLGAVLQIGLSDVDNDGDRDLVGSLVQRPNGGLLLRNNGTGSFSSGSLLATTSSDLVGNVVPVDLDADGDRDLLVGSQRLRNDGTGLFAFDGRADTAVLSAVDIDRDRFEDLVTVSGVWRNQAGLGFVQLSPCPGAWVGDLDGDGDPDAIGLQGHRWIQEGGRWSLAFNDGQARDVNGAAADLDGDGDLDWVDRRSDNLRLWINDGTGNLAPTLIPAIGNPWGRIVLLDHDGDGDVDLLYAVGNVVSVPVLLRNDGNLAFTDVAATAVPAVSLPPELRASDVDGDGDVDVAGVGTGGLLLLRNLGNGTFADDRSALPGGVVGRRLEPAQLDRDADVELVVVGASPVLQILDVRNGAWIVLPGAVPPVPATATHVVPIDIDDDGDLDLMVAGTAQILQNDGNGLFADVTATRGPGPESALQAVDLDGDGDLDLFDAGAAWLNMQRQLEIVAPCSVGGALALEFTAERGRAGSTGFALVCLGASRSMQPVAVFGGQFFPDPQTSVLARVMASNDGVPASATLPVPAQPWLRGLGLRIQGLVIGGRGEVRLANHLFTTIE